MRFILFVLIVGLVAWLVDVYMSHTVWWIMAVPAFVGGLLWSKHAVGAFFIGFLAIALSWGIQAYGYDAQNEHRLATKMGILFGNFSAISMVMITAFLGGVIGGFSALSGRLFATALRS